MYHLVTIQIKKSLKTFTREYVKYHCKTKNPKYWKEKLLNDLKRETIRTYSEQAQTRV